MTQFLSWDLSWFAVWWWDIIETYQRFADEVRSVTVRRKVLGARGKVTAALSVTHCAAPWRFIVIVQSCNEMMLVRVKFPGCGQSAAMGSGLAVPSVNSWGGGSLYTVLLTIYCTVFVQFHIVQCSTIVIVCICSSSHSSLGMTPIFCRVSCSYLIDGEISVWQRTLVTWLRISQAI